MDDSTTLTLAELLQKHTVIPAFLLSILALGLWSSSGVTTVREYAIANRSLGTGLLVLSLIAATFGGNILESYPNAVYEYGLIRVLSMFGNVLSNFWIGFLVAPQLVHFSDCYT